MIRLHTTKVHRVHRQACSSWKHNVRDDFQASIQHEVAVLIPYQSDGQNETEKERKKDGEINKERERYNAQTHNERD